MFEPIAGLPDDALGLSARGTITAEDYERTLIPLARQKIAAHGKTRVLLCFGPDFEGYSAGAIWQDAKFGLGHLREFGRIAVVSDVGWITQAVRLFAPFVPSPVRVFPLAALDEARSWLAG